MNLWIPMVRSIAILATLVMAAASPHAAAQHIEPEVPPSTQQRGSLGQPFPGLVEDLEVIGPDRFVLTVSDRPDGGGLDRVEVYTPMEGPIGRPFLPDQRKIYDVAPDRDGGFWVLYYSADEIDESRAEAAGMRLQRFDRLGEPVGEDRLLTESLLIGPHATDQGRRGWIIPLQNGAVAVAFTSFMPDSRLRALRFTTFYADGEDGVTELLEEDLTHMPNVSTLPLADGGAAMAWGTGNPMGERLSLTTLEPDGQWNDSVQSIWSSSTTRGHAFNLRLTPIMGSDDLAAVFSVGPNQVWQRFDQNGVARSGVEDLNSTGALVEPVRIEGTRLVGLAGGRVWPVGVYAVAIGDAELQRVAGLDTHITAFASESAESVVVAAMVRSRPDATDDSPIFSYLYRFR